MAEKVKVEVTKEFLEDVEKVTDSFLEYRSEKSAQAFQDSVEDGVERLRKNPYMGQKTNDPSVRSLKVGFDFRMYYKVIDRLIRLLNLFSTRANPKDNPFD